MLNSKAVLLLFFAVAILFTQNAQAYLDPGTGSYALQITLGSILASWAMIAVCWRYFKEKLFFWKT